MTEFRLLGTFEVELANRRLDLGPAKQRAVFAALLIELGRPVSAEMLIDQVWEGRAPAGVRSVLYTHISRIRALLGEASVGIHRRAGGYLLDLDPDRVDLHRFRRLVAEAHAAEAAGAAALFREALDLWRGKVCADLPGDWIEEVRTHADAERLAALLDCVDLELRLGQHVRVRPELRSLATAYPLNERLVGLLMLAEYRGGEQAKAIEWYQSTRRGLAEELGVDPGPDLQRLFQQVLQADPALTAAPAAPPVPAASQPVPAQLPHDVDGFTGRKEQLDHLHSLVPGTSMAIVIVDGTAGVGKTALAVHFGHEVRERFPDGQLFVDLRGYAGDRPVRPIEALALMLHALGVAAEETPVDLDEAVSMYRSMLAGRRMLVVLDNARSADQVRPLLPAAPGSLVVITSRERLDGLVARDAARRLTLDVLSPDEARTLLDASIGTVRTRAEMTAVAALATACAYLPLALRIAVANLISHPHLSVASLVEDLLRGDRLSALQVYGDTQAAVRAAFDVSYAALDADAQRLFRRLGLVPGHDLGTGAAAAVDGTSETAAAALLDRLAAAHLVDQPVLHRYTFHDLLRQYATERADIDDSPAERDAAVRRLLDWYTDRVNAAAAVLYPEMLRLPGAAAPAVSSFASKADAMDWLEGERANLVATVAHAREHGHRPFAWLLADALRGYYVRQVYTMDWMTVAGSALAAAQASGDPAAEASAHLSLGDAHTFVGGSAGALDHYSQALTFARTAGWQSAHAAALNNLGNVYWQTGQLRKAAAHYDRGLALARRIGWRVGEANSLANLGLVCRELGRLTRAADHFTRALELDRQTGSRYGEAVTNSNLGEVWHALGRLDLAYEHLRVALRLCAEIGDRGTEADTLHILAAVHLDAGRADEALGSAQAAITIAREVGDLRLEADALNVLGRAEQAGSRCPEAVQHHRTALDLARRAGARVPEVAALIDLAHAQRRLGDAGAASAAAKEALTISRRAGYRVLEGQAFTALAEVRLAERRPDLAAADAERALAAHRATGHRLGEARSLVVLSHALRAAERVEDARTYRHEAMRIFDECGIASGFGSDVGR